MDFLTGFAIGAFVGVFGTLAVSCTLHVWRSHRRPWDND
jgi:hypothetical protein